jgi:hypothetical protein
MPAREVTIDGLTLWVEVDELEGRIGAGAPGMVERGAVVDRVRDVGADLRNLLAAVTRPVRQAFDENPPDEWSVELSIGFKGELGVPCLTKGEANAAVKITAKWKKA